MTKIKAWVAATRLRTLPLSISGIIVGSALAATNFYNSPIFWLAILTTIGFQILSNFANDYGDGLKGTDANRQGEKRMVASGMISYKEMRIGMFITGILTFFTATLVIFQSFGMENLLMAFVFFNLAILAIVAAIKYTVGSNAYGYSGLGDLFVFLFFGFLSVLGSYFLFVKSFYWELILPALSVGSFSTAVLNLNNLRDVENDAMVGKNTLVVKMGLEKAKQYHTVLLVFGMCCALVFTLLNYHSVLQWIYVIAFIPFVINIRTVWKNTIPADLDGELKKVALSTFLFAILLAIFH